MKTGFIYKIVNNSNGKIYIGQTISSITKRFSKHISDAVTNKSQAKIAKAIRKYGKDSFSIELLETIDIVSGDELNNKEIFYIKEFNSKDDKIGYNITDGGNDGGTSTWGNVELVKKKISDKLKGIPRTERQIESAKEVSSRPKSNEFKNKLSSKFSGEGNPFFGKKHNNLTKSKISSAKIGIPTWNKGKSTRIGLGENHPRTKVSDKDKIEMFESYSNGISAKSLGLKYGISKTHVHRVINFIRSINAVKN